MIARLLIALLTLSPLAVHGEDRYRAVFSDPPGTVRVTACFEGPPPRYLYRHEEAANFTQSIRIEDEEVALRSRYGRLSLPSLPADSCIDWEVSLVRAADSNQRLSTRIEGGFLTSGNLWFWRDNDRRPLTIEVVLPDNISISTPWKRSGDGTTLTFVPAATSAEWTSRIAIGSFPIERVSVPGTHLRLAALGNLTEHQRTIFTTWIRESANTVGSVYGEFPQQETQVLIVPVGPRSQAVPFARVVRGGGGAVEFFVDENRSLGEYRDDWKATHELSHLLLPFVSSKDRWLSEGAASYYQNILRARDGRLSEEQAWRQLNSGFERGRDATRRGESLASATRSGWSSTMRVYWSGAAILLKADTLLRAMSDGSQSLDTALAEFHTCCFETHRSWRARELFSRLDELTGHQVFTDLYHQHVPEESFPDTRLTYEFLGLEEDADSISIDSQAPGSLIRRDIMTGRQDG